MTSKQKKNFLLSLNALEKRFASSTYPLGESPLPQMALRVYPHDLRELWAGVHGLFLQLLEAIEMTKEPHL